MKSLASLMSLSSLPIEQANELGYYYPQEDINTTSRKVSELKLKQKQYAEVLAKVQDFIADFPLLSDYERIKYREAQKYNTRINAGLGPLEAKLRWMKLSHALDFQQPDKNLILKYSIERSILPAEAATELNPQFDVVFYPPYIEERAKYMLNKYRIFTYAGEPTWEAGDYIHRMKWLDVASVEEDRLHGVGKTPIMDLATQRKANWKKLLDFVVKYQKGYMLDSMKATVGKPTSMISAAKLNEIYASPPVSKNLITSIPLSDFSTTIEKKNVEDVAKYEKLAQEKIEQEKLELAKKENQDSNELGFIFTTMAIIGTFLISTLPAFIVSFLAAPFAVLVTTFPALGPVMALVPEALMPLLTTLGQAEAAKAFAKIAPDGVRKAINVLAPMTGQGKMPTISNVVEQVAKAPETIIKTVADGSMAVAETVVEAIAKPSLSLPNTGAITVSAPKVTVSSLSSSTLATSSIGRKVLSEANQYIDDKVNSLNQNIDGTLTKISNFDAEEALKREAEKRLMEALMPKTPQYPIMENGQLVAATKIGLDTYQKEADANKPKETRGRNALLIAGALVGTALVIS